MADMTGRRVFITGATSGIGKSSAASAPELAGVTGAYLKRGKQVSSSKDSQGVDLARRLWEATEKLVTPK